jgi:hypothetical protein
MALTKRFAKCIIYSSSLSSPAKQPWQHLSGLLLSGQSTDKSVGQIVMQSHFVLSSGQTNFFFRIVILKGTLASPIRTM